MKHSSIRRTAARFAIVGTVVAALAGSYGAVAAGATVTVGNATITDPANSQAPLASGAAAKLFSVALPANASCPGDSATGGYLVDSFLVQQGTDPSTVTFVGGQPSQGYGLNTSNGNYYGAVTTATNTGQVVGIPSDFQFSQLTANSGFGLATGDLLYSGTSGIWEAGIACANGSGQVTNYWTTEVTFTASGSDPSGFTWAAVPGVSTGTPEVPLPIVLPILGLAVIGGSVALGRRRNRRPTVPALPMS